MSRFFVPRCCASLRIRVFLYVNIRMALWDDIYIYIWVYIFWDPDVVYMCFVLMIMMMSILSIRCDRILWDVYVCVAWCNICQSNTMLAISSVVWFNCLGICVNVMELKCPDNSLTCGYLRKRHGSRTRYTLLSWRTTSWESRKMLRWQIRWC